MVFQTMVKRAIAITKRVLCHPLIVYEGMFNTINP